MVHVTIINKEDHVVEAVLCILCNGATLYERYSMMLISNNLCDLKGPSHEIDLALNDIT